MKEDAETFVEKVVEEDAKVQKSAKKLSRLPSKTSLSRNKGSMETQLPRWGALTFEEKLENDMVVNRVRNIHAKPHITNYLKANRLNTASGS